MCVVAADDVVFEAADEVIDAEVMVLLEATAPTANAPTPTSMDGNHIVSCLVDLEALDEFPGLPYLEYEVSRLARERNEATAAVERVIRRDMRG